MICAAPSGRIPQPRRRHRALRSAQATDLDRIVELQIERFRERLRERDIGIELAPAARSFLADKGFDPVYGARPLKRAITTHLENPLARRLIAVNSHRATPCGSRAPATN